MIPSSPRRTWQFLGLSLLLYYGPDMFLPDAWNQAHPVLVNAYQGVLVLLGFAYAPAICRAMVLREVAPGPLRSGVDTALAHLGRTGRRLPPLVLAQHDSPFVLTAGLLPGQCQVFISSALASRLSPDGLGFLLARAAAHATWRQRLVAFLPVLAFTVLVPNDPKGLATWLFLGGILLLWLCLHWLFELDADRQAASLQGAGAVAGLRELLAATASPLGWLSPGPSQRWRLWVVERES